MYMCNLCRAGSTEKEPATMPAGDVGAGLAVCGYEPAAGRLPELTAADQVYSSGFCPDRALSFGTMFPELVSEY